MALRQLSQEIDKAGDFKRKKKIVYKFVCLFGTWRATRDARDLQSGSPGGQHTVSATNSNLLKQRHFKSESCYWYYGYINRWCMAEAGAILSSAMASQELPKPPARRGRPRRKGGPSRTVVPTLLSPISRTDHPQNLASHDPTDVRPREERSYKEFFPDLDLTTPLSIVRTHAPENDALLTSELIPNTPEPSQKEARINEQTDDNLDLTASRSKRSIDKLPNGNRHTTATPEPTSTGMLGAISRTLNFARSQLAKKEIGNVSVQESSPDFEESDLSSVGDSAATSSEEAASTPKSIQKHDQQESTNMQSQAGDSNPYQALSTRPMHGTADVNLSSAPTQQVTLNLPKPSFWKIEEPKVKKSRAEKLQNDADASDADETFRRPENHYIRYIGMYFLRTIGVFVYD